MPLIVTIVVLTILRFFEIGPVAELSWWWIAGLFGATLAWFEFGEKLLGLDKKRAHDEMEKIRQERIKKNFK
jgi:small Trp-rich protein